MSGGAETLTVGREHRVKYLVDCGWIMIPCATDRLFVNTRRLFRILYAIIDCGPQIQVA
jgi:hypothetical protein